MISIQSKKGQPCPFKAITCQEGYCQDCQIYLDRDKYDRQTQKELDDLRAMREGSRIK